MKNSKGEDGRRVFISEHAWRSGGAAPAKLQRAGAEFQGEAARCPAVSSSSPATTPPSPWPSTSPAAGCLRAADEPVRPAPGHDPSHFVNAHGLSRRGWMSAHDIAICRAPSSATFPTTALYSIQDYTYGGIKAVQPRQLAVEGRERGLVSRPAIPPAPATAWPPPPARRPAPDLGGDGRAGNPQGGSSAAGYSLALLNYGFRFFETHRLYEGQGHRPADLVEGRGQHHFARGQDDIVVTIPRGRYGDLKAAMDVPGRLVAPYARASSWARCA